MGITVAEDIIEWSTSLTKWKQDALRRLAVSSDLTDTDKAELLDQIREDVGLPLKLTSKVIPVPLVASHISPLSSQTDIVIKCIKDVHSVNQLVPSAELTFQANGLTVIYGTNGSGKSGFVRIFRSACRSRIQDAKKLKVLSDVYGGSSAPQSAKIVISDKITDETVDWSETSVIDSSLQQVAVFDSQSAQIYIDSGNQIQFLPLGLDLPLRFNSLCLSLKDALSPLAESLSSQLMIKNITFSRDNNSPAQTFYNQLSDKTTDEEIEKACSATDADKLHLKTISEGLSSAQNAVKVQRAISLKLTTWAGDAKKLSVALNDIEATSITDAINKANTARAAASLAAKSDLSKEPLDGVGSNTWRLLWEAAKQYSLQEAYPEMDFPVLSVDDDKSNCVLCQQELETAAVERMKRFNKYMDSSLESAAVMNENILREKLAQLPSLGALAAPDFEARLEGLDNALVEKIKVFKSSAESRLSSFKNALKEKDLSALTVPNMPVLTVIEQNLLSVAAAATTRANELESASDPEQKKKLLTECENLTDLILLTKNKPFLIEMRNILGQQKSLELALSELKTTSTTRKATELIDKHVTKSVLNSFKKEQQALNVSHLKVSLTKKSNNQNAEFKTDTGTTLTKKTSEILSEGEQRALALSAFFTEIEITVGNGPIVIDDPVTSLDRERGKAVANRIVEEANTRQVIVFTHDIIFCNQLFASAHGAGVPSFGQSIFRDSTHSGKVDPLGLPWKGLSVKKRVGKMKEKFNGNKKVAASSPTEWEAIVRGLYGNLRDTYERMVEEDIFFQVVQRGVDAVQTQRLRRVKLSDTCATEFHSNMTKISAFCHDNPASDSVPVPTPKNFEEDLAAFESLRTLILSEADEAEAARPSMKSAP